VKVVPTDIFKFGGKRVNWEYLQYNHQKKLKDTLHNVSIKPRLLISIFLCIFWFWKIISQKNHM